MSRAAAERGNGRVRARFGAGLATIAAFERTADELATRIGFLIQAIEHPTEVTQHA